MAEENNVEQTTETKVEEKVVEQTTEQPKVNSFTEEDVNNIVKQRLAKERASIYKKLDVEDLETAIEAVANQKKAEEQTKIQKGEFEQILKEKSEEFNKKYTSLESELKDIKINKAILSSASKNRAINPDQVVELLKHNLKLNEEGQVEINFAIDDNTLVIKVTDQGVGFDSNTVQIPKIEQKIKSDHKRGWGLQLIKELMDTVEFESTDEGTTVTMTKKK